MRCSSGCGASRPPPRTPPRSPRAAPRPTGTSVVVIVSRRYMPSRATAPHPRCPPPWWAARDASEPVQLRRPSPQLAGPLGEVLPALGRAHRQLPAVFRPGEEVLHQRQLAGRRPAGRARPAAGHPAEQRRRAARAAGRQRRQCRHIRVLAVLHHPEDLDERRAGRPPARPRWRCWTAHRSAGATSARRPACRGCDRARARRGPRSAPLPDIRPTSACDVDLLRRDRRRGTGPRPRR